MRCEYCGTEHIVKSASYVEYPATDSPRRSQKASSNKFVAPKAVEKDRVCCPSCKQADCVTRVIPSGAVNRTTGRAEQLDLSSVEILMPAAPKRPVLPDNPTPFKITAKFLIGQFFLITLFLGFGLFVIFLFFESPKFNLFECVGLLGALFLVFVAAALIANLVRMFNYQDNYPKRMELKRDAEDAYQREMVRYRKQLAFVQEQKKQQSEKNSIWLELYHCSRDDIVFLPAEGDSAPAKDMESFIDIQWNRRFNRK